MARKTVALVLSLAITQTVHAEIVKQEELRQEMFGPSDYRAAVQVAVGSYCINGHEFVVLYGVGAGGGSGAGGMAAVSQVYEEREGRSVPRRCGKNSPPAPPAWPLPNVLPAPEWEPQSGAVAVGERPAHAARAGRRCLPHVTSSTVVRPIEKTTQLAAPLPLGDEATTVLDREAQDARERSGEGVRASGHEPRCFIPRDDRRSWPTQSNWIW